MTLMHRLLIAVALFSPPLIAWTNPVDLPDMGASAAAALTPEQEQRIGKALWRRLREAGKLVDDPDVAGYLHRLGLRLASHSEEAGQAFTFFAVDDPTVNAFALPGGYIGVHTGLILASGSEDELAAVMAHEIAHVTQNHLARGVEKAQNSNLPLTAAVIAAILLGANNPEVAEAAIAAGTAGAAQMQLDFTRAHEHEADRIGIDLLADAGYDPNAMAQFFQTLQRQQRFYSGVPEFLRTHPVNEKRIADASNRARHYPAAAADTDDTGYRLTKANLAVASAADPLQFAEQVRARIADASPTDTVERYTLGLALARAGHLPEALSHLRACLEDESDRIAYIDAVARLELEGAEPRTALRRYQRALELYPGNERLTIGLAKSLSAAGRTEEAIDLLEALAHGEPTDPEVYRLLGHAHAEAGHHAASQLAVGNYYFALGETHGAIVQLERALKQANGEFYLTARIEARLEQLKQEAVLEKALQ